MLWMYYHFLQPQQAQRNYTSLHSKQNTVIFNIKFNYYLPTSWFRELYLKEAILFKTRWITFKLALCRMPLATASLNRIKSIWASTVWCLKGCNSAKQFHYQIGRGMSMCCISLAPASTSLNIKQIKSVTPRLICRGRSECHQGQIKLNTVKCTNSDFPLSNTSLEVV